MTYSVFDEEMSRNYLNQHYLASSVKKREKDHITIVGEISGSEAREALAKRLSWFVVDKTEKKLHNEVTELQERIDQLTRLLDQPFISPFVRESADAHVRKLESELRRKSSHVLTTSIGLGCCGRTSYCRFVEGEDDKSSDNSSTSGPTKNIFLQDIFIASYVKGSTYWRAIQVRVTRASYVEEGDITARLPQVLGSMFSINKDSLSHFQNCPLPPLVSVNPISRTQERHTNLLTKGCSVRSSPYIHGSNSSGGHTVWKKPRRLSTSAFGLYKKPPPQHPVGLLNCSASYLTFSKKIQTMPQKPCQFCLDFIKVFTKETMPKFSNSYIFFSFLSGFIEKSEGFPIGEMN